jgi:RNA polymerase sigma-70 factor (ECF subfamily)
MKQAEQEEQFLGLVDTRKHIIYKVCFIYASGDENISDMFQEAVLNMWKAFPKFRG